MRHITTALFLAVLCVAGSATSGQALERKPALGDGDIHFRLDHTNFRATDGATELELYVEIDNKDLQFVEKGSRFQGKVRISFQFFEGRDRVEKWSDEAEFDVSSERATRATGRTQVLQLRLNVPASADSVHAKVEDLNARKRGLFHMFAGTPKQGKGGKRVTLRSFPQDALSVSDVEFARSINRAEPGSSFYKSGLDIEPSPGRVFGRPQTWVGAYYEVYDLRAPSDSGRRSYELRYRLRSSEGAILSEWSKRIASTSAAWADTVGFEVVGLPAGSYNLQVGVRDVDSEARGVIEGPFEVIWETADWVRWTIDQDELVPFYLNTEEQTVYTTLGVGARSRFLDEFWLSIGEEHADGKRMPKEENPVYGEFMRRVAYVNERYTSPVLAGMHTDMGRIYIKYGEPDEVRREVIPIAGNDLNSALAELDLEQGTQDLSGTRSISGRDDRAFEVWIYNYRGNELFARDKQDLSTSFGMRFVFTDDLGTDQNLRLIRSTERMDF